MKRLLRHRGEFSFALILCILSLAGVAGLVDMVFDHLEGHAAFQWLHLAVVFSLFGAILFFLKRFGRSYLRAREHLDFYSRHGRDAVLLIGPDDRIQAVNDQALRMYGYSKEAFMGLEARHLSPPMRQETYQGHLARVRQQGCLEAESIHLKQDGTPFPVEITSRILEDGSGHRISIVRDLTERKALEAKLELASQRWRTTFDSLQDMVWVLDAEMRIQAANKITETLLGRALSEVIGQPCWTLLHGTDGPPTDCPTLRMQASKQRETLRLKALGKNWFLAVDPILDAQGQCLGAIHVLRDLTEFETQTTDLCLSEHRFRALFETTPEAIALVDRSTGDLVDVNPTFCTLYGYTKEELLSLKVLDLSSEPQATTASLRENQSFVPLRRHHHKDGTALPVELRFGLLEDNGQSMKVLVVRDLRPQFHAEEVAQQRQAHLQSLVALGSHSRTMAEQELLQAGMDLAASLFDSPIGFLHFVLEDQETLQLAVWVTGMPSLCQAQDDNHAPISQAGIWVETLHQRQGLIHNDCAGKPHKQGVPEDPFPLVHEMGVPVVEEDQVRMTLAVGNRAIPYSEEDLQLFQVVAADLWRMVQRNRVEEDLRKTNQNLEAQVALRTRKLTHLNQELEAFSYSVSHDLRAPLRAITGFAEALAQSAAGTLTHEQQDFLHRVRQAGMRMGDLIEDLLTLSRLGARDLQPVPFDLGAYAQEALTRLQASDPTRRVELCLAPNLIAMADAGLTKIALDNLLSNAWKFTAPKPQATIEVGCLGTQEGFTTFFVKDNGVGFPSHKATHLFTAFQRLHPVEAFQGTGIGLAMVRRIINRQGGLTWAEGAEGEGASFYFTLPALEPAS